MDSILKRRRRHDVVKVRVEGDEDRISNLPRKVMGHILSFLPTKNAVATATLSTKWKYLWTSITNLDFDDELLVAPTNPWDRTKFINSVHRVFRNVSHLQKFRLRCIRSYDASDLNLVVEIALSHNLRELHLSGLPSLPRLPGGIFTCRSLVVLKLDGTFVLNVPNLVHLEKLEILVIDSLEFLDNGSIYRLISKCPVLRDMTIKNCDWRNISVFNISAPNLRSLIINCRHGEFGSYGCYCNYKIVLNTPSLQYLQYEDYIAKGYSVNINALVKANINFVPRGSHVHDRSMAELAIKEVEERISRVQWLYLSGCLMKLCRLPLPMFHRLTYLEFGIDDYVGWKLLLHFLLSSPKLETLILGGLSQDDQEKNQATFPWNSPEHVPSCLLFHLKKMEIKQFTGESGELKMAEYFLENSRVLEKLVIRPLGRDLEICKKVLMLPRYSNTCRVEVL